MLHISCFTEKSRQKRSGPWEAENLLASPTRICCGNVNLTAALCVIQEFLSLNKGYKAYAQDTVFSAISSAIALE